MMDCQSTMRTTKNAGEALTKRKLSERTMLVEPFGIGPMLAFRRLLRDTAELSTRCCNVPALSGPPRDPLEHPDDQLGGAVMSEGTVSRRNVLRGACIAAAAAPPPGTTICPLAPRSSATAAPA